MAGRKRGGRRGVEIKMDRGIERRKNRRIK